MKNLRSLIIVLAIAILSTSCKSALLRVIGMRMPRIETKDRIEKFLLQKDQPISDVYCMDTTLAHYLRTTPFKPGWPADFRPIQIRAYNTNGKPILHWASCEGYLEKLHTFDTVPPRNLNNLDSTLHLQNDLNRYFTLDGHPANIKVESGYDYYFVVTFGLYFPKMSKTSFRAIEDYKANHPNLKIKTYYINVDVLDWWRTDIISDINF